MSDFPQERRMNELPPMERHILQRLDLMQSKLDDMTEKTAEIKTDVREIKQDINDAKNHSDRLTRLEQRMDDADAARKSIGENIRWLIALVITSLLFAIGQFFKK